MTDEQALSADACVGCERLVPQCDDLGLCPDCAAKLDRMMRDRDWERSWTAWHTPADQREALRAQVIARYGARYELIAPPALPTGRNRRRPRKNRVQGDEDATA
jgi:predicted amidophosphoribosyltransferase